MADVRLAIGNGLRYARSVTTCGHCGQRKGKRRCPALAGSICSLCCGKHRLVAIACPPDCVHLGGLAIVRDPSRAVPFTQADDATAWDKLRSFALGATEFSRDIAAQVGGGSPWEPSIAIAYIHHGHRGADGRRLIEHFLAARGRALTAGEAAAMVALQRARASLFEITAVRHGVGVDLRDLLSDEILHVRELTGSAHLREHEVLFTWVMEFPDHRELTGAIWIIERSDVARVRAALQAELAVARTRWPGIPDADLVGSIAWVVADACAADVDDDEPAELPIDDAAAFQDDDRDDAERGDTGGGGAAEPGEPIPYDAGSAPDPGAWLATDESRKLAAIEAYHRALEVDLPNPRLHATMHAIVENQLAANAPIETRATLARFAAAGIARHDAVHALGSVVAAAIWDVMRRKATVDHEAIVAALGELDPDDWRAGEPEVESPPAIPLLAHELMYRHVPGLQAAIARTACGRAAGPSRRSWIHHSCSLDQRSATS